MSYSRIIKIILLFYLLFSIGFSFRRYYYFTLEGDLPAVVLPDKSYEAVMKDPFGLNVLLHDSVYPAPNRYFAHLSLFLYFKNVPLWLQHFFSPVDSVYISCAIAKTAIHFSLVFLLALYITGRMRFDLDFLLAAALVNPLFQTFGFNDTMGIIDHSITYTFFYALSHVWMLLFFLPFFLFAFHRQPLRKSAALMIVLIPWISFNGPLNTAVILLVCPAFLLYRFLENFIASSGTSFRNRVEKGLKNIPVILLISSLLAVLFSLYSFYIGRNNAENLWNPLSLQERYARLPLGLWELLTRKPGYIFMLILICLNLYILKKQSQEKLNHRIFTLVKWLAVLSILYVLLLPLGGYREYRPVILRRDTILPITLGLTLCYGLTGFQIIRFAAFKKKQFYYAVIVLFAGIFIKADRDTRKYNLCERDAFEKIARSTEKVIFLDNDCAVMNWGKTLDTAASSNKTDMLHYWGIIDEKKWYYQK